MSDEKHPTGGMNFKDYTPKTLGAALRMQREETGLKLKEVSEKTGLSISYLSDIERGRTIPTVATLAKIVESYGYRLQIGWGNLESVGTPANSHEVALIHALRKGDVKHALLLFIALTGEKEGEDEE